LLRLSEDGVVALVGAGYLRPTPDDEGSPRFAVGDLKAFVARNADEGAGTLFGPGSDDLDPDALLVALDGRSEEMARRAFDVFVAAFPDAATWSMGEQYRFIAEAKARFEAILAVTALGDGADDALTTDLQEVGAGAAWAGSSLPQLLLVLRISRDLVVQTAVEVAEERGRHWGLALSLLLTRVLPAVDRLTDAVAQGYWNTIVEREQERDVAVARELDSAKAEFLTLITSDLRNPLTTILGLGATLEAYAADIPPARIAHIGGSIRGYAERIARLADDLYDISRLDAGALALHVRPVPVASAIEAALASVPGSEQVAVRVPAALTAMADTRRLEQVVANLIENALTHGALPVVVDGVERDGRVEISVRDHGAGVPPALIPTLFSRLRTFSRSDRDRSRGTGLGLALAKGLVEGMGGAVAYEPDPGGGACFRVSLLLPRTG